MPRRIWRHFGDAQGANTLMIASIVQASLALLGLVAVWFAWKFWQVLESHEWPVMLLVVGVPWTLLGVFGKLLTRGNNYIRYIRCMWMGLALGILWLAAMAITAVVS